MKIKTVKWILRILIVASLIVGYVLIVRDMYFDHELFVLMWECFGIPIIYCIVGVLFASIMYFGVKFVIWVFSNDKWKEL